MAVPGAGYKIRITVTEVKIGKCTGGMKVGDTWLIERNHLPANLCMTAFCEALYPKVRTLRYGGEQPWDPDKDVTYVVCPDQHHQVVYEVRRIRE